MKRRILILGSCLLLAACSAGGTKSVTGAIGPPQSQPRPTPPPNATWSRETGINNNPANISHQQFCENTYGDPYRGGWITICAGGKQDGSSGSWVFVQGAVWVETSTDPRQSGPESSPPSDSPINEYDAPNSPTWVKIVSVNGDVVNLQRQDGSTLTFNLQTTQFS